MTRYVWGVLSTIALGCAAAAAPAPADLVLLHGKIHTQDANRSVVQALALRGNTIVAVGTHEAIGAFIGARPRGIDLGRRVSSMRIRIRRKVPRISTSAVSTTSRSRLQASRAGLPRASKHIRESAL